MMSRQLFRTGSQILKQSLRHCTSEPPPKSSQVFTGGRGVNQVILLGNLGSDPEVKGSESRPLTTLSLATSQNYKTPSGEYVQRTQWHRISIFRPVLRDIVATHCKKGDKVYVTGSLQHGEYIEKETGRTVRVTNVVADDVVFLTPHSSRRGAASVPSDDDSEQAYQYDQ